MVQTETAASELFRGFECQKRALPQSSCPTLHRENCWFVLERWPVGLDAHQHVPLNSVAARRMAMTAIVAIGQLWCPLKKSLLGADATPPSRHVPSIRLAPADAEHHRSLKTRKPTAVECWMVSMWECPAMIWHECEGSRRQCALRSQHSCQCAEAICACPAIAEFPSSLVRGLEPVADC